MYGILLTQNSTPVFKYIVWLLGKIMEGIFWVLEKIGIPNVGLAIILFTIIMNIILLPLTYKQQKFSKLQMKMNPEIKAIQKKYEGKRDQASAQAQNAEMQEIYAKYGVSPTGSCLFLLIQMPIMIALYRVIYAMPAYVARIKEAFFPLVDKLAEITGGVDFVQTLSSASGFAKQFQDTEKYVLTDSIIDVLNRASTADFQAISDAFPSLAGDIANTTSKLDVYNVFLGLNIGNSPWYTIKDCWSEIIGKTATGHVWWLFIGALLIPLLAGATQWISIKLSPNQQDQQQQEQGPGNMAASMKMMNYMMPLMSVWFCFTLPAGMGLYWIASAVVRCVIMVIINKKIDRMDMDELIKKNSVKSQKKIAKMRAQQEKMNAYANMSTKNIQNGSGVSSSGSGIASKSGAAKNLSEKSAPTSTSGGSMMSKANMVKDFNERNNK